jgi:hypothetical protein
VSRSAGVFPKAATLCLILLKESGAALRIHVHDIAPQRIGLVVPALAGEPRRSGIGHHVCITPWLHAIDFQRRVPQLDNGGFVAMMQFQAEYIEVQIAD